jgi:exodeoxyribonuclease VII large subunit
MKRPEEYLSISTVAKLLNDTLEECFPKVFFIGEITEFNRWSSGHIYFTMKDDESQLSCVMWKSFALALTFTPKVGDKVLCTGRPNLYNKNGRFQMVVSQLLPSGEGALQKRFIELKNKLTAEGLFAPERKRALPFLPKAIGVVTSGQGAVIHDIMVKIRERMPHLIVYLADVKVQGPGSAEEIVRGIQSLNAIPEIEVIIVARGGGSLDDLWSFNEEIVVRAVYASRIPIISGVGHEVDVTLCDLAADVRAPTPTAAAEMVVPHKEALLHYLEEISRRLHDTDRWLQPKLQALDECEARLARATEFHLSRVKSMLERGAHLMQRIEPQVLIERYKGAMRDFERRLESRVQQRVTETSRALQSLQDLFEALSPQRTLERGFSIVESHGKIISSKHQLKTGDIFDVRLSDGVVSGTVTANKSN